MDTTSAILLRRVRLSDTSLIVTWLTEEHGKLKTVAKGARSPRSKFAGVLDLFYNAEIQFSRSRNSELHILREAVLKAPHEGIRGDYLRVELASYFVQLLELVTEPEHPTPELFHLLQRALRHLSEDPATERALNHFESETTRLLGIWKPGKTSAAGALVSACHRLPPIRADLLPRLRSRPATSPGAADTSGGISP